MTKFSTAAKRLLKCRSTVNINHAASELVRADEVVCRADSLIATLTRKAAFLNGRISRLTRPRK